MNKQTTEYASYVWDRQWKHLPAHVRVQDVANELRWNRMSIKNCGEFSSEWVRAKKRAILQIAVRVFSGQSTWNSGDVHREQAWHSPRNLAEVERAVAEVGGDLKDVLSATKAYLRLKTRKARRERLHS